MITTTIARALVALLAFALAGLSSVPVRAAPPTYTAEAPVDSQSDDDRLEAGGLVERRPAPNDRRAYVLYLTPAAEPLLDRIRQLGAQVREEAMAGLSPETREQLMAALLAIKTNLSDRTAADLAINRHDALGYGQAAHLHAKPGGRNREQRLARLRRCSTQLWAAAVDRRA